MRERKPYYKKSHDCWYYNDENGKPVRLDNDKKKAHEIWKQLRANEGVCLISELADNPNALVADLCAEFLDHVESNNKTATYEFYRDHLKSFNDRYPNLRIRDLKNAHVTKWLEKEYKNCGPETRKGAIASIKRAMSWLKSEGYLKSDPVADYKRPKSKGPNHGRYVTPAEWQKIIEDVQKNCKKVSGQLFLDVIETMRETGCRPQEITRIEARHLDHKLKAWVFPVDESKGGEKTGRERIVYLTDKAYAISCRLAMKYPEGPLFRNRNGNPWNPYSTNCHFQRIKRRTGIKCCLYSIRHTFATDAILNGVDLMHLKEIMGHSDLQMLTKIYQHINRKQSSMRDALDKAVRPIPDASDASRNKPEAESA